MSYKFEPTSRAAGIFSLFQTIWIMLVPKTRGALFPAKVTTESYHFILSMAITVGWGVAPRRERDCPPSRLPRCLLASLPRDYSELCVVSPGCSLALVASFILIALEDSRAWRFVAIRFSNKKNWVVRFYSLKLL